MNEVNPLVVMSIQLTQFSQPKKKEPGKNPVGLEGEEKKPCRLPTSLSFVLSSLFVLEKKGKKPKKMLEKKRAECGSPVSGITFPSTCFYFPSTTTATTTTAATAATAATTIVATQGRATKADGGDRPTGPLLSSCFFFFFPIRGLSYSR